MSFWQAKGASVTAGVDDMVLLSKVTDSQIVDNLNRRYMSDLIYTYIGPVLIALNPYKSLPYFTDKEIELYHGSTAHENPPHIYALAEAMFQNMLIDDESQCVIISGESGAGKTESSKLLMNYISAISGKGGSAVEETKRIILGSNPLLEAFGNAKTLRNNNSSRFGKYFEIQFTLGGQPFGGHISNFLLEKSRVVCLKPGERNFHIFYHLLQGASVQEKQMYGVSAPSNFLYLNQSRTYEADGINDVEEFTEVKNAMSICGISPQDQSSIFAIVAGILHLGNVTFVAGADHHAMIQDEQFLAFPAHLFGVDPQMLKKNLLGRLIKSGGRSSIINVQLNVEQAINTRDALAKALYSRMFDWIIGAVNFAITKQSRDKVVSLGVLDIYGFEIFEKNGFEQLCINYVNEKLQQVFIELTLKSEQEEYVREGIKWTPIDYFNNKVVVDLIESKRPAGLMAVLDDICVQLHGITEGVDQKFVAKLDTTIGQHQHYRSGGKFFTVVHYAGQVSYDSDGFCEANKDTLYRDLIQLAQSTNNPFIANLFPDDINVDDKKRPTTAAFKIRNQSQLLVETLMKCTPSYIRCIKPNEKKKPREWESARVEHQVRYLNLRENINVRRAGFCYRNTFEKFLKRYGVLNEQTFKNYRGSPIDGVHLIMRSVEMDQSMWQPGRSKVFIKAPESLFMLEELRERKYHDIAIKIQRAYRRYKARKFYLDCKKKTVSLFVGKKERKRLSINREFKGDYLNVLSNPVLRNIAGKDNKILFCDRVKKYDRRWKSQDRELLITDYAITIVADEPIPKGPEKGKIVKVVKRTIPIDQLTAVSLSTKADDLFVIHSPADFDNVLESVFKTELVTVLSNVYQKAVNRALQLNFVDNITYSVKKTQWSSAASRQLAFVTESIKNVVTVVNNSSSVTTLGVPAGLPKNTEPTISYQAPNRGTPVQRKNPPANSYAAPIRPPMAQPMQAQSYQPPQFAAPAKQSPMPSRAATSGASNPRPLGMGPNVLSPGHSLDGISRATPNNNNGSSGNLYVPNNQQFKGTTAATMPHKKSIAGSQPTLNYQQPIPKTFGRNNGPPGAPPPKPKVNQCKALYTYQAREADEISFQVDDLITILSKDNEGWWTGIIKGKRGLFPSNYVKEV